MRALTPLCEPGVSGSGVGESGSRGPSSRVVLSSRAGPRAVGGVVKKRFSQKVRCTFSTVASPRAVGLARCR